MPQHIQNKHLGAFYLSQIYPKLNCLFFFYDSCSLASILPLEESKHAVKETHRAEWPSPIAKKWIAF